MNSQERKSLVYWRWLFLALETLVAGGVALSLFAEFVMGYRGDPDLGMWTIPLAVLYGLAYLFLLIASPFFLRSLRGVALAGWLIAFGVLFLSMLFPV